jgi:hypothetical protein
MEHIKLSTDFTSVAIPNLSQHHLQSECIDVESFKVWLCKLVSTFADSQFWWELVCNYIVGRQLYVACLIWHLSDVMHLHAVQVVFGLHAQYMHTYNKQTFK